MSITQIKEQSKNAEMIQELNKDELDPKTNSSTIDLMTRLDRFEITNVLALDSLVSMNFLPLNALTITRQKKRLAVSLGGEGRREIVEIFKSGKEEEEEQNKKGFLNKFFGGNN